MATKINLTKAAIENLQTPSAGRYFVFDATQPGLCLLISSAGSKTWYHYRKFRGKPERSVLGKWPKMTVADARSSAAAKNGKMAEGVDPSAAKKAARQSPTVEQAFREFVVSPTRGRAKRQRTERTIADYEWQFTKWLTRWKETKLSEIRRADVEAWHNALGEASGHYAANRALALLRAVLNLAVDREHMPANPAARVKAFEERSRSRFLGAKELPAFMAAVEASPEADFFKLSLMTGARRGNVLAMRWSDVDLVANTWSIPKTKSGAPLVVPLTAAAVTLLKDRRKRIEGVWVFPGKGGDKPMGPPRNEWKAVLKAAKIDDLRLHDLRRSLGSWMTMTGSPMTVVGAGLGHSSLQATAVYSRTNTDTVRAGMEAAADAILAASKPKKAKRKNK